MATKTTKTKSVDGFSGFKPISSAKLKSKSIIITKHTVMGVPAIDLSALPVEDVPAKSKLSVKKPIKLSPTAETVIELKKAKAEPEKSIEQPEEEPELATPPSAEEVEAIAASKQAEKDAALQELIDNKTYILPINSIEKRSSRQFVMLGLGLSVLLLLAWADIALDAGIIHLAGIKPLTHFFSN